MKTVVTAALPYANGSIHVGHLIEYIQTDIFVRFLKLMGEDAIYVCADDTHGTPIELKARKQGVDPAELVKRFQEEHKRDFDKFSIYFDSYYSTDSEENKQYVNDIFRRLKDKGLIYTKDVENYYDEEAGRFLPDRFVKGKCPKCGAEDQYGDVCEKCNTTYNTTELVEPYSVITGKKPVRKSSEHYFFKLSALSDKLDEWLKNNKNLQPEIVNYVRNWISNGLEDWDISRDAPYFGFNIPGEEDKYFYVWMDAPVGYISSTANYCKDKGCSADDYWRSDNGRIIHFIGKDIIYFHLLFWPAMLMEAGFNLPENIVVHGFLTINKEKMSKSRGTFITAEQFSKMAEPEFLRYYYAGNLARKADDIDLSFDDFKERINTELVGNIANFVYRVLSFTNRKLDSRVVPIGDDEKYKEASSIIDDVIESYRNYNFRKALNNIERLSAFGNKHMQEKAPWKEEDPSHTLAVCVNIVKDVVTLLKPILPKIASQWEEQLNMQLDHKVLGKPMGEHTINKANILIRKIDKLQKDEPKYNLKVARIEDVEDHPDADKLYVLNIDMGEKRQLVAGLKGHYSKEELKGKNIVVLSNLKPAKLKGIKSEGMLLAASDDKDVRVLSPEGEPGDQVYIGSSQPYEGKISIKELQRYPMTVNDGNVFCNGEKLRASKDIECDMPDGSKVN